MKTNNKIFYWLAAPIVAFLFVLAKVYPVLPAVMQDEYVYSIMARYTAFAEQAYPNYLFSFVYKSTSLCGEGFYSCAKNLNIIFFIIMLVFVYLIAARLLNRGAAIAIVTITVLSPLHVYISYFMPEAMYFAFMMATIWFVLHATQKDSIRWWLYSGIMFGLTALVKPHAVFAVPVIIVFAFVVTYKREGAGLKKAVVDSAITLGSFLVIKFGLGFAFAGAAGLTLFGTSYGGSVDQFVNQAAAPVSQALASGANLVASEGGTNMWQVLTSVGAVQLAMHFGLLLFVFGVPTMLGLSVIKGVFAKKQHVSDLSAFVALVASLAISYAIVVSVFEGFVTALGDDHSARIITRYYDFLIPPLVILSVAVERFVEPKLPTRLVQAAVLLIAAIWVVSNFPSTIQTKFSDSVTVMGLLYYPAVIVVMAVIVFGAIFVWLVKPEFGAKLLGWFAVPLMVVTLGLSSQGSLLQKVGVNKAYFDIAGQTVKPFLEGVEGSKIGIVGKVRQEVFTAKFWIDKPGIQDRLLGSQETLSLEDLSGLEYALFLGTTEAAGAGEVIATGEKYVLVKFAQ